MLTFHATVSGEHEHAVDQPFAVLPFEAAGTLVMIVEDGSGWVADGEGHRVEVVAPQVVVWAAGDRVEYGTDAHWRTRDYWGPRKQPEGFYPAG